MIGWVRKGWRHQRWSQRLLLLLLVLLCPGGAASADGDLVTNQRQLQALREQIATLAQRLESKGQAERALVRDLGGVEEALSAMGDRIAASSGRLRQLDLQAAEVRATLAQTTAAIKATEGLVRLRLAALYKRSDAGAARMLFSGDGPARIAEDFDFFQRIVRRDRQLLNGYRLQLDQQRQLLTQLDAVVAEQREVLERRQQERVLLREAASVKDRLLLKIRGDRKSLAENLQLLREQAAELAALVKRLESSRSAAYSQKPTLFAAEKGRLPWPAAGRVRIGFGTGRHPDLGTIYQSQGLELVVPREQPVTAIWPGRVVFASPFRGYGNLLIIDHGEGYYTLYAQVTGITRQVGEQIAAGDLLATPGGDKADRLYFEIRKGSSPLDPRTWLSPRP